MRLQCKQGPPSVQQTYRDPGCHRAANLLAFVIVQQTYCLVYRAMNLPCKRLRMCVFCSDWT